MKLPAIKLLVENHTHEELRAAEMALFEEQPLPFDVPGDDEGEKLTHLLAAIFVLDYMTINNCDYMTAVRVYTKRVRESIS